MKIEIDFTKSAQENASEYYDKAKKARSKAEGAEAAVKRLESKLKSLRKKAASAPQKEKRQIVKARKQNWYEKFHWFFASNGALAIGGRDAHQNETLNSKHFEDADLFFHADIFGASVTILKNGESASKEAKEEAAQFAACNSSAWKDGLNSVNVYAMRRNQVSKSTGKGSLGTGSFLLTGEREWYRGVALKLVMYVDESGLRVMPHAELAHMSDKPKRHITLIPGDEKKSDAAKAIGAYLSYNDLDHIMQQLPAGSFKVERSE